MTSAIPVVDFAGAFSSDPSVRAAVAERIGLAGRDSGFFYIVGHGVPDDLLQGQLAAARRFFAQSLDGKMAISIKQSANMRGYDPVGAQSLDLEAPPDLKETVIFGRELGPDHPLVRRGLPFEGGNQWPADLPGFRDQVESYTAAMAGLGQRLAAMLALSLHLPEDYFEEALAEPNCAVRLLHYPPQQPSAPNQLGAGAHTDWGLLTILLQDDQGGLEVLGADGVWIAAPPIPGTFVVNLGDMVPRMTNGRYRSNLHRVRRLQQHGDRYSVATFFNPPFDYVFTCAPTCLAPGEVLPPPCSFGAHIQDMMRKTHAAAGPET